MQGACQLLFPANVYSLKEIWILSAVLLGLVFGSVDVSGVGRKLTRCARTIERYPAFLLGSGHEEVKVGFLLVIPPFARVSAGFDTVTNDVANTISRKILRKMPK